VKLVVSAEAGMSRKFFISMPKYELINLLNILSTHLDIRKSILTSPLQQAEQHGVMA